MRALLAILIAAAAIGNAETKIQLKDLPTAVRKTVQEQTQNATLKGVSKEKEAGKTLYEVETVVNGKTRDLMVDPAGNIVSIEEQTSLDTLPGPARAAIEKQAGTNKIESVEKVTEGSKVSYEAVIVKAGKKSEFTVNADGSAAK